MEIREQELPGPVGDKKRAIHGVEQAGYQLKASLATRWLIRGCRLRQFRLRAPIGRQITVLFLRQREFSGIGRGKVCSQRPQNVSMVNAFHCCTLWETLCLKLAYSDAQKPSYQVENRLNIIYFMDLKRSPFGGLNLHWNCELTEY